MANYSILYITNDITLDGTKEYVIFDPSEGNITCTLPAIGSDGDSYWLKRVNARSSNTVTLLTQGSNTIEGQTYITLSIGNSMKIIAHNNNFYIL